jgi:hypothetical protein
MTMGKKSMNWLETNNNEKFFTYFAWTKSVVKESMFSVEPMTSQKEIMHSVQTNKNGKLFNVPTRFYREQ